MNDAMLAELTEWLRIPSISTGEGKAEDLVRGAQWAADKVRGAGGEAELVTVDGGHPIVVGDLRGPEGAPTVLIYGHYDVQGEGDRSLWTTPPFEPTIRDGRLYGRGTADDKGNFFPLLYAACELAKAGSLPVNVRVAIEGEEEVGGASISQWMRADERGADAAIVFDSGMEDENTPAITVGLRGIYQCNFIVRTGARDLHQGLYGGAALGALNALHRIVAAVLPDENGVVRDELQVGIAPVAAVERESWARLTPGAQLLADAGAHEVAPGAADEFYERTGARPTVDLDYIESGAPRTVLPAEAKATITIRLAPGQQLDEVKPVFEQLMREAAPEGAEIEFGGHSGEASFFDPESPVLRLAASAIASATGMEPAFVRSGGSIPVVADFSAKGIPTIVSGFSLPDDAFHAPNESYRLASLELGEAASRELLQALAGL